MSYNIYVLITKSYKFRLKPTAEQEALFVQFAGCRRFVWNWGLQRKQEHYKATGKGIGYNALAVKMTELKKEVGTTFLGDCNAQVLQQSLMDLEKAFTAFFEKRARYPRFKSRKRTPHAFRFPQAVRIEDGAVKLPKVGRVKAVVHRPTEGVLKSATVKQEGDGAWFIVFVAHVEAPDVIPACTNPVGIDVGLESFATLSTGEKIRPPKFFRKGERKLKRLNRALARCRKQSSNRAKAKKRLAQHHQKVKNQRADFLHKLSAELVGRFDTVCIENLNIKGLARTKLAKSFNDAGLGGFLWQLGYKTLWHGGQVVKVGRFFPSSKTCHLCRYRAELTLKDRQWTCGGCGTSHDRDVNAALNILQEGLSLLAAPLLK